MKITNITDKGNNPSVANIIVKIKDVDKKVSLKPGEFIYANGDFNLLFNQILKAQKQKGLIDVIDENELEFNPFISELLTDKLEKSKIDYDKIKENSISLFYNEDSYFDINVIIPVKGRVNFSKPMFHYFCKARENSNLKINYTVVEFSDKPEHSKFCKNNKIDYVFIQCEEKDLFNKCLCLNFGVLFGCKSKYVLFHDLDCLMQSNFFNDLIKNLESKKCRAIQCFTDRRVLYLDRVLTEKAIDTELDIDSLKEGSKGVSLPSYLGAPGGSIMVERELFFEVGGYDPELFQANAPEDAFFWEKVNIVSKMEISNNPKIELFHMNHPVTYNDNPFISDMKVYWQTFFNLRKEAKMSFINLKKKLIEKYE
jgi:predicted glycosyltransferase involved in capsule biosynthesis